MTGRPFEVVGKRNLCAHHRYSLHADEVAWPDGTVTSYAVFRQPEAALILPLTEAGTTFLVSQWRHSWDTDAWELPAGTVEEGEPPPATARRELVEEVGLEAGRWDFLGTARATAVSTMRFHFYLARELTRVERRPEIYEQDMVIRELPLEEALDLAAQGTIQHAASIAALFRAQWFLAKLQ
ncbi:MAG: NUDIX hydrolase [Candidatus Dormibacteraeota bacterium]|nr:NUDIX hydrolase [Candidatus Dormibacteraeota bacterium]